MSPFETLVVESLSRAERKLDALNDRLTDHTEQDRVAFSRLESHVDILTMDHDARKRAAQEAAREAAGKSGRFWAAIAAFISAVVSALVGAAS